MMQRRISTKEKSATIFRFLDTPKMLQNRVEKFTVQND
jgi:hypothetical protein